MHIMKKHWEYQNKDKMRKFLIYIIPVIVWIFLCLIPFAFIGIYYFYVWATINYPLAMWVDKYVGFSKESYGSIFFTTLINGLVYSCIIYTICDLFSLLKKKKWKKMLARGEAFKHQTTKITDICLHGNLLNVADL